MHTTEFWHQKYSQYHDDDGLYYETGRFSPRPVVNALFPHQLETSLSNDLTHVGQVESIVQAGKRSGVHYSNTVSFSDCWFGNIIQTQTPDGSEELCSYGQHSDLSQIQSSPPPYSCQHQQSAYSDVNLLYHPVDTNSYLPDPGWQTNRTILIPPADVPLSPRVVKHVVATGNVVEASTRRRLQVNPEQLYNCPVPSCMATFTARHNLKNHIKSHLGEKEHKCLHCPYKAVTRWDLKRHTKSCKHPRTLCRESES